MLDLLGLMLAAGGPQEIPARIAWPLHQALQGLDAEVRRDGLLSELPVVLDFRPSPEVGLAASGANSAIFALLRDGVLRPQGTGRGHRWWCRTGSPTPTRGWAGGRAAVPRA